jgi:hypothetical protein
MSPCPKRPNCQTYSPLYSQGIGLPQMRVPSECRSSRQNLGRLADLAPVHDVLPPDESEVGLPKAFLGYLAQNAKHSQLGPAHNGSGLSR